MKIIEKVDVWCTRLVDCFFYILGAMIYAPMVLLAASLPINLFGGIGFYVLGVFGKVPGMVGAVLGGLVGLVVAVTFFVKVFLAKRAEGVQHSEIRSPMLGEKISNREEGGIDQ